MRLCSFLEKDEFADAVSVTAHSDDDSTITQYDVEDVDADKDATEDILKVSVTKYCSVSTISGYSTTSSIGSDSINMEAMESPSPLPPPVDIPSNLPHKKNYIKQTSVPSQDQTSTALSSTTLGTEDRQALWLIWSTLRIHAEAVHQLDESAAVGKLMLKKLYTWNSKRMRQCLQCPPEGRGGILADMARHILAYKMGNVCSNILCEVSRPDGIHVSANDTFLRCNAHDTIVSSICEIAQMVRHDISDIARELVEGMQNFLVTALPDTAPKYHRSTSPRDWSLLARAWTESMQECCADIWTPKIHDAWSRVMTILLRSIFKALW